MELTCTQMDVLLTFYIEGELSSSLKSQVEEHIKSCATCRAKYDIIKSMFADIKSALEPPKDLKKNNEITSLQFRLFKNNLSAYIDNELTSDENLKIKKFTINNNRARKELEENYSIKKLMKDSFNKTKNESRQDFSRSVLKQLELDFVNPEIASDFAKLMDIQAKTESGKDATMIWGAAMPYGAYMTKEGKEVWKSIKSPFFDGLIADMLGFFETGKASFDPSETLEVMRLRDAVLTAVQNPDEEIEV